MSIAKDVLFFIFIGIFIYCLYLRRTLYYQKEVFLDTLKHDLKIPILAQNRAISLMNIEDDELIREVYKSSENTLDMINAMIDSYEYERDINPEDLNLSQVVIRIFNDLTEVACTRKLDLYYGIDDDISLFVNGDKFYKFLFYLFMFIIDDSSKESTVSCLAHVDRTELTIEIKGYTELVNRMKHPLNNDLVTVGYKIRMDYCKNFARVNGWKLKEHIDQYNMKTFTIRVPLRKKENLPQIAMRA